MPIITYKGGIFRLKKYKNVLTILILSTIVNPFITLAVNPIDYYGPSIHIPNLSLILMTILAVTSLSVVYIKSKNIFSKIFLELSLFKKGG